MFHIACENVFLAFLIYVYIFFIVIMINYFWRRFFMLQYFVDIR